jgi:hypothetical protein
MPAAPAPSLTSTSFRQRTALRFWLGLTAIGAAIIVLGVVALGIVNREIRHLTAGSLTAALDTAANGARDWLQERQELTHALATRPAFSSAVAAAISGDHEQARKAVLMTEAVKESLEIATWAVVDASGTIVLAPDAGQKGHRLPAAVLANLERTLSGTPTLTLPQPEALLGSTVPCFVTLAQIPGTIPAALLVATDCRRDFAALFANNRPGESGETYAFDDQGRFLSESRFIDTLSTSILPAGATSAILALDMRDATGSPPGTPRKALPLTRAAAMAISGNNGLDLDGYRDYRGVEVVGGWRWLPEPRMGIAVKLDRAEAYRALLHLTILFAVLLVLTLIGGVAVALAMRKNANLARRARHAERQVEELGQYQLERKLGEGGMGAVYIATHRLMRRQTAVKVISGTVDAESLGRFEREVQACCRLNHPNTIAIYDYGRTVEGTFFYAMEYLSGMDLETLVTRHGPVPPARVIHLLLQACGSLAEAHRAQLLHRDIKPANLFLTERGGLQDFLKVLDFGLVKTLEKGSQQLSKADIISGTPTYMAPETISQQPNLDGRVDLYALGLVGYFLLTTRLPFVKESTVDLLMAHLKEAPAKPSTHVAVPADLEQVILSCLAKNPADRPRDAEALAMALMACADAGRWTQVEARAWWAMHGEIVPPSANQAPTVKALQTLHVSANLDLAALS